MNEEIMVSLGPKERILLDEILKSSLLRISTTEEALLWSLAVAKLFLAELEKLIAPSPDPSTKASEPFDIPGIKPVPAPSPTISEPFGIPGIKPVPAPSPAIEPVPAVLPMIRILLEEPTTRGRSSTRQKAANGAEERGQEIPSGLKSR